MKHVDITEKDIEYVNYLKKNNTFIKITSNQMRKTQPTSCIVRK